MRVWISLVACLALGACDDAAGTDAGPMTSDSGPGGTDSGPGGTDSGPGETDAGGGGVPGGTVRGVITRTATLSMPEDGMGTIWIDVGPACPYSDSFAGATTAMITGADMNDPGVMIPYEVTGLTPGTYFVWAWLDDNGDTSPSTPFPAGDPGNFPVCPTVTVTATEGATADLLFDSII